MYLYCLVFFNPEVEFYERQSAFENLSALLKFKLDLIEEIFPIYYYNLQSLSILVSIPLLISIFYSVFKLCTPIQLFETCMNKLIIPLLSFGKHLCKF